MTFDLGFYTEQCRHNDAETPTQPDGGTRGYIRGQVTDSSDSPVGNTAVEIVDTDTVSVKATLTTRSDGSFGPEELPPGNYTAEVTTTGVDDFSTKVNLEAGETEPISVTLVPS